MGEERRTLGAFRKRLAGVAFPESRGVGLIPESSEWKSDHLLTQGMAQILPAD